MALDAEQRRVARRIQQIAREVGAGPKQIKAAYATGLVESGLRNLPGGDADSQGWRQERASLYSNPRDLDASIRRFFAETAAVKGKYGRAGELAAAVQRPAAQYRGRYQERSVEADALMRQFGGGGASTPRLQTGSSGATGGDNSAARGAAIAQFLGRRNQDPLDFAMQVRSLRGTEAAHPASPAAPSTRSTSGAAGPGAFKVTGPNPGRIKPSMLAFGRAVAAEYGRPISGSDGTGHSYRTVNGNVSQHSTGNAVDIPATGRELLRMGRAALIAAGMPRAQAMKQKGGLYNVGGHQIIFLTNSGGNHFDHLHVSAR